MYYSFSNNSKREQAYFFCSSYRKNSDICSAHYIREKVVEQLVLESMQRIMLNVQVFEKEFARKQMACYTEEKKKLLAAKRRELERAQKRIAEIDTLIQKIYEDNASGKLSDERYATIVHILRRRTANVKSCPFRRYRHIWKPKRIRQ